MTRYTRNTASSRANCIDWNDASISSLCPETVAVMPSGIGVELTIREASRAAAPRSPKATFAVMIATRSCPARWISAGPSETVTSATASSVTGRFDAGLTIRLRISSTLERRVSTLRTSTSIFLSRQV